MESSGEPKIKVVKSKKDVTYVAPKSPDLQIDESTLRLKLLGLEKSIHNKCDIFCYLGLLITILAVLYTANFTDKILKAEVWEAIFIIAFIILSIYCRNSFIFYLQNKMSTESIISFIKTQDEEKKTEKGHLCRLKIKIISYTSLKRCVLTNFDFLGIFNILIRNRTYIDHC